MRFSGHLVGMQDRLAAFLGCDPAERAPIVAQMLDLNSDRAGYWLKLAISTGMATLGLVLGSSAVVIGAMLIAPLMTPLVVLGMGLAVGSPFLVLRSSVRVVASVGGAVGASALITRLLPFNEINSEIASRTTPTALDLFVAAFCALAGVLAVVRRDSDIASTAAGTSIGISLVPPLCVSGYGIGTSTWTVASGAALLFLTNFVAIVVVSTLAFSASGFGQIDIRALEAQETGGQDHPRVTRRLAKVFASRGGPWLRLLMPLVLLAAVYVPLRQALDEVVWQIRARKQVESIIAELPYRLVESRVHIERQRIQLTLVLLGSSGDAARARARVERALREETGISPRIDVLAIPDAGAFASLEAALHRNTLPTPTEPPATTDEALRLRRAIASMLEGRWPEGEAGPILSLSMEARDRELILRIVHQGAPLDGAARTILERIIADDAGGPVRIDARALPAAPLTGSSLEDPEFMLALAGMLDAAERGVDVYTCVQAPGGGAAGGRSEGAPPETSSALDVLARRPRVQIAPGPQLSIRFAKGGCPASPPPAASAAASVPPVTSAP